MMTKQLTYITWEIHMIKKLKTEEKSFQPAKKCHHFPPFKKYFLNVFPAHFWGFHGPDCQAACEDRIRPRSANYCVFCRPFSPLIYFPLRRDPISSYTTFVLICSCAYLASYIDRYPPQTKARLPPDSKSKLVNLTCQAAWEVERTNEERCDGFLRKYDDEKKKLKRFNKCGPL